MSKPTNLLVRLGALLVLGLFMTTGTAWAQTIFVAPGADPGNGGASDGDATSLRTAITAVNDGFNDVISFRPGMYEADSGTEGDLPNEFELLNDVTFEITGGVSGTVTFEDVVTWQLGDVNDPADPFDDDNIVVTLDETIELVLDDIGDLRFAFDAGGTPELGGDDTPSMIIGDGVLVFDTDGESTISVDDTPGRAVIENLQMTDDSNGTVSFINRNILQFNTADATARLHVFGSFDIFGGTFEAGRSSNGGDLIVSLDVEDTGSSFTIADSAELTGSGDLVFVLVDTFPGDGGEFFSTAGAGPASLDFEFPFSEADDSNSDNSYDVDVTFSQIGEDESVIGGTISEILEIDVESVFPGVDAFDDNSDATTDPKVRFTNLTLVNGDLEILGTTPGLDTDPESIYDFREDLDEGDDEGTAVGFRQAGVVTGLFTLHSGALTLFGGWNFEEDAHLNEGTLRLSADFAGGVTTVEGDTFADGMYPAVVILNNSSKGAHNLKLDGDIEFDTSPLFSFQEAGAPFNPSEWPITPREYCGADSPLITSNIGSDGYNVVNELLLTSGNDQDIRLNGTDLIVRRTTIIGTGGTDVELNDDNVANFISAATNFSHFGTPFFGDRSVVGAPDSDASSFVSVSQSEFTTNGRLNANGTSQIEIIWTATDRGILSAGDADRAYTSDALDETPFKNRYVSRDGVAIFSGDELAGNSEGRSVDVDLNGDGADGDVVRVNIVQVAMDDEDPLNFLNTPLLTIGKDIAITCNLDLYEGRVGPGSAQIFLANDLLISVRNGRIDGRGNPPFEGEVVFPTETAPGDFGLGGLILGSSFSPSNDGIDLYYYSTMDRTISLEWPTEFDTDIDVVRDVWVDVCLRPEDGCGGSPSGPTIALRRTTEDVSTADADPDGAEEESFRINRTLRVIEGEFDIIGREFQINAVNGVNSRVFVDSDANWNDSFFYGASKASLDLDHAQLGELSAQVRELGEEDAARRAELFAEIREIKARVASAAKSSQVDGYGYAHFIGSQKTDVHLNTTRGRLEFNIPAQVINRSGSNSAPRQVTYDSQPFVPGAPATGNNLTTGGDTVVPLDYVGMPYFTIVNAHNGHDPGTSNDDNTATNQGGIGVTIFAGFDIFDIFGDYNQFDGEMAFAAGVANTTANTGASDFTPAGGFWFMEMRVGFQTVPTSLPGNFTEEDGEAYFQGGDLWVIGDFQLGLPNAASTAHWNGYPYTYHYQFGNFYVGEDQDPGPGFYLGAPCTTPPGVIGFGSEDCGHTAADNNSELRNQYAQGGWNEAPGPSGNLIHFGPTYEFQGTGDIFQDSFVMASIHGLDGIVYFAGNVLQTVLHRQDEDAMFNKVEVTNSSQCAAGDFNCPTGILTLDNMWVNWYGTLNLDLGNVNAPAGNMPGVAGDIEVIVLNPTPEGPFVGRNSALDQFVSGFGDGARDSYVAPNAPIRRTTIEELASGGDVNTYAYYFPHGWVRGPDAELPQGREFFQPLLLQTTEDQSRGNWAKSTRLDYDEVADALAETFEPFNTDAQGSDGTNIQDGLLVNTVSQILYQVEYFDTPLNDDVDLVNPNDQIPSADPNIRISADGLPGVLDLKRIRILHWSCDDLDGDGIRDYEFLGLAGVYDTEADGGIDDGSFFNNDFINGIPNLIQEGVDVRQCNIFGIGANGFENPIDAPIGGGTFVQDVARLQLIHDAPGAGEVDVYLDGEWVTTLEFDNDGDAVGKATGFGAAPAGNISIDVVPAGGAIGDAVLSATIDLTQDESHVVVVGNDGGTFNASVLPDAKLQADGSGVDIRLLHNAANAPSSVDIRTLDPFNNNLPNRILANNLDYLEYSGYTSLAAETHSIEVSTSDNAAVAGVYLFNFNGLGGEALTCFASNTDLGKQDAVAILCADINGNIIEPDVITDTESSELPAEFALEGNYPNPFNPSTTIQFDLPETAEVSVEVIDMLGRRVMTLPAQTVQAGADRTFQVDAANLASGVYLYRLIVKTANGTPEFHTGRMTLVK